MLTVPRNQPVESWNDIQGRSQAFVKGGGKIFPFQGAKHPLGPKIRETIDFIDPGQGGGGPSPDSDPPYIRL